MKGFLRGIAAGILAVLARAVLAKYKPKIVMVTGSVGKTSTKDAIAAALSESYYLRASEKSYNSEFGVPLTIIGAKNPWTDAWKWLRVMDEAVALLVFPNHYPKLLVLEVGADRPGDLARILRIATPDAVVVTRLPDVPVHVEAYASPAAVREEEFAPAYALPDGAPLIISSLDEHAKELARNTRARVITVGYGAQADVHISEPALKLEDGIPVGMHATIESDGKTYPLIARGALGKPQMLAPAAGFALARALGVPARDAFVGLERYAPPPGRGRLLRGIRGSTLIDDTYNASPAAVEEALAALSLLPKTGKHIAVLGDMLELGRYSASEHERIGALAASQVDVLVAVGTRSRAMRPAALSAGMPENAVHCFDAAHEAAPAVAHLIGEGDSVLIKGSQGIRMERIVEALIADPAHASKLVRQEREWKKRK